MTDIIQRTFLLMADFVYYSFGLHADADIQCDLLLAVCSALCCVAVIRLFWTLFD